MKPAAPRNSQPASSTRPPLRRVHLAWMAATVCLALAGCAAPKPVAEHRQATRSEELTRLGFKQTDDGWEYSFPGKILFEVASDTLDPASQAAADRIGAALRQLGVDRLRVEGHTDNVGSATFNQTLSLRRAEAVARALSQKGLALDRMEVRGLGKEKPIVTNDTLENRSQNRRVAVIVPAQ
ncbi:MAG: hypothetical protein JWQ88_1997 [Rhodoferax sp.]|nr:hypothetical protein [Rhodoferax sp.]